MSWEVIAVVRDILGAAAVIATLTYLSIQTSQTQRIAKAQASQHTNQMFNHSLSLVATSPTLARLVNRIENGEELSGEEFVQFRSYAMTLFNAFENYLAHSKENVFYDAKDSERALRAFMQTPGAVRVWEIQKHFAGAEFVKYVAEIMYSEKPQK